MDHGIWVDWRAREKQASRDRDAAALAQMKASGDVAAIRAMTEANDFFRGIDVRRENFRIVAIGRQPFGARRAGG